MYLRGFVSIFNILNMSGTILSAHDSLYVYLCCMLCLSYIVAVFLVTVVCSKLFHLKNTIDLISYFNRTKVNGK